MAYFAAYGWLMQEQPKQLMERIGKAAAQGDPNAAKYAKMLEKAADLTQRSTCGLAKSKFLSITAQNSKL